jgi:WhiB family redox-sensing transcriptional regulator
MHGDSVDAPLPQGVMGLDDHTWRSRAACLGAASSLFFPDGREPCYRKQVAQAKEICASCPVREPCRTWALAHPSERGVWGGLTERERRVLRRRSGAAE